MYTTCLTSSEVANILISTEFRIPISEDVWKNHAFYSKYLS